MPGLTKYPVGPLLAGQASDFGVAVLSFRGTILLVSLQLPLPSGRTVSYVLRIDAATSEPSVGEQVAKRLPRACPDRHINADGSFCMGFPDADPIIVVDAATASLWWQRLVKFLILQETTSALKRWPSSHEWAHGPVAALHQRRAETCASVLGPRFAKGLAEGRLEPGRRRGAPGFFELRIDGIKAYSVWVNPRRVATLRQVCVCGSGRPIVACGDHATCAADLPFALMAMEKAEAEFWRALRGKACCGTLRDCPLRADAANDVPAKAA